jgi:very-short-patch-repair endonuclease
VNPLNITPQRLNQEYEQLWQNSQVEQTYLALVNERFDLLASHLHSYNSELSDLSEFKASLEMLAYTTTELLAQLASGGMRWISTDKARFLSPTIDIESIIRSRALESPYFGGFGEFFQSIMIGAWDFLQVSEHTRSWFEALDFSKNEVGYLLWAAYKTLISLKAEERTLGFTPLALNHDQVLETFCKCESPIESVLYMQLVVDGLLPPILQAQWSVEPYRLDFAIPDGKIAIECDGAKYHNASYDTYRDRKLGELGWIIFRFSSREILERPDVCSDKVHSQYPWKTIHADMASTSQKFIELVKLFSRADYIFDEKLASDKFPDLVRAAEEYNCLTELKVIIESKLDKEEVRLRANELTLEYDPKNWLANTRVIEARDRIANLQAKKLIIEKQKG